MVWARTDQKDGVWSGATNGDTASHTFTVGEKVLVVSQTTVNTTFTGFSDTLGNTYTTIYSGYNGNDSAFAVGLCDVTSSGASAVKATWGASGSGGVALIAGTGLAASFQAGKFDHHFVTPILAVADSADASLAGVTPSAQPCYLFAFFGDGYAVVLNEGTGMTREYIPANWPPNGQDGLIVSQRLTSLSSVKGLCTPLGAAGGVVNGVIVIVSETASDTLMGQAAY